eukprot:3677348-Amphidinium_carterae.1
MTYIKEQRAAFGNSTVVVNLGGDAFGPPFQDHPGDPRSDVTRGCLDLHSPQHMHTHHTQHGRTHARVCRAAKCVNIAPDDG